MHENCTFFKFYLSTLKLSLKCVQNLISQAKKLLLNLLNDFILSIFIYHLIMHYLKPLTVQPSNCDIQLYDIFKAGKVAKDVFIKQLRSVVGDEMLRSTIQEIHTSEWGSSQILFHLEDLEMLLSFISFTSKKKKKNTQIPVIILLYIAQVSKQSRMQTSINSILIHIGLKKKKKRFLSIHNHYDNEEALDINIQYL